MKDGFRGGHIAGLEIGQLLFLYIVLTVGPGRVAHGGTGWGRVVEKGF